MAPDPSTLPPNPELVHVDEVADRTAAAQNGNRAATVHHQDDPRLHVNLNPSEGAVYVTAGVPDLRVQVNPGQSVNSPEGHPEPGSYGEGDQYVEQGPTAHMLEARGIVTVLEVAA